ncbi:UDP-GalNAc:beta-1,3-N-acetylgalactosaminyltransferase 2-like [Anneissia japonica]|uniref:UDP-GalNAc:beta-1, 3-N-acetylgalactosaminyltransferase 2-like n=1 Tax=Anneissia japonica TaxID=1529436 RepID=UPI001425AC72|nr:UDP-GalNAc:beta-1,3-N-acetylgalactosaminyltransferase 2-like [Anneissia japonica]
MSFRLIFTNTVKTLLIPVFCVFLAVVINFIEDGLSEHKDLVIAVLSARKNFAQREALRNTWVESVKSNSRLKDRATVNFVIGGEACHLHDDDKVDKYSCEELNFNHKSNPRNELLAFKETSSSELIHSLEYDNVGFDFKVHHDIVIVVLGVLDSCIQFNQNPINVSLYDALHKNILASANFSVDNPGMLYGSWRFKYIEQLVYPKGFEGSLVTHNGGGNLWQDIGSLHVKNVEQDEGVITIKKGLRFLDESGTKSLFEPLMAGREQLAASNMIYVIDDSKEVHAWLSERSTRDAERLAQVSAESESLKKEQQTNNDLVFVDVVDVYSNIPTKLLKFYKWVSGSMRFKYVMKVDDDTFVNPAKLLEFLDEPKQETRSWWGHFRRNWKVNEYGKWADMQYNSLTYPPFACGSGNILSSDLVRWIAKNTGYLHCYQGEDISVGIWLAAVQPHYMHDSNFICDDICEQEMILSAQNSPKDIQNMWDNLLNCADPCGCNN